MSNRTFFYPASDAPTSVDTSFTTLPCAQYSAKNELGLSVPDQAALLHLEVENDAGSSNALDGFKIQLKDNPGGEWYDYLVSNSAGSGDFESSLSNLLFVTDKGPHEIAAGETAHVIAKLHSAFAVRVQAKSAGSSDVTIRGNIGEQ